MSSDQRKRPESALRACRIRIRHGKLWAGLAGLLVASACGTRPHPRTVSVHALETAQAVEPSTIQRAIVSDAAELDEWCYPLGRRMALVQVRSPEQWALLRRVAPELRGRPDLTRGIVIGLISRAGLPLNGIWPIRLKTVRVHEGAGFVVARFDGGSFLPDGTTYIETAQINGLSAVLMVEVNATRFYPQ